MRPARRIVRRLARTLGVGLALSAGAATAYPLDGHERTGIPRLAAYHEHRDALLKSGRLVPGSLQPLEAIRLGLADQPELALPAPDPRGSAQLKALLGERADAYAVAVLDLSNPERLRYLAHRDEVGQNPGSIGKLVVALATFQALANRYPDDLAGRHALLRATEVVVDAIVGGDHHEVPIVSPSDGRLVRRPLAQGDRGNLYAHLDWMLSSSSNGAASALMQELVLMRRFGSDYPPEPAAARAFLQEARPAELGGLLRGILDEAITSNGLDLRSLRQGGMFTAIGKRRMPTGDSHSTARELMRFLLQLEQGRLVDPWSSLELKRLLYLTDRRIRYASHPALASSAVYFKSGSLYSCVPEPDFVCRKYHGNVRNYMNSVAIVESIDRDPPLHYLVVVLSNVLRQNSAVDHQTLALRIHRLLESFHPKRPTPPPGSGGAVAPASEAASQASRPQPPDGGPGRGVAEAGRQAADEQTADP